MTRYYHIKQYEIKNRTGKTCLFFDIFKGRGGHDRETDEEDVCLGITQRSQPVVVFLTWRNHTQIYSTHTYHQVANNNTLDKAEYLCQQNMAE